MANIQIENVNFNYDLRGSGKDTLVFISGYTGDIDFWQPLAQELEKTHKILTFDNQAIGKTTDPGNPLTTELMAHNIVKLLNALKLKNPTWIGYAMGTSIALEIAHLYPDSVNKLILISPVRYWNSQAVQYIEALINLRKADNLDEYFKLIYKTALGKEFKAFCNEDQFVSQAKSTSFTQTISDQERQANALKKFDCRPWIKQIKKDTLILSPIEDQFAPHEESKTLAENINAQLEYINCGHCVMIEAPTEVIDICKKFLLI